MEENKTMGGGGGILINANQRGNPLLGHLRNCPYRFEEISADYGLSPTRGALYLAYSSYTQSLINMVW